ncbi:MAG: DNA replication/repair protein RecF [candidate division KSB1 bacterium]|nr:DNA replication/repair protein RecF [candidate division KSB1 bacterium]MDQ7065504.1 DNA replication/repair protein RecF [candidate division KSB1 bacterium]
MILQRLQLTHFRNFDHLEIQLEPGKNYFIGENGQGKTNLLEGIYCLGLIKSFRASSDQELVQKGFSGYQIVGDIYNELAVQHKIAIVYNQGRKAVSFDGKKIARHATLVGQLPIVLFNPEDHRITSGSPSERRRFLDIILSQSHKSYLASLQEFQKILKHRNRLLANIRDGISEQSELEVWDWNLAKSGQKIMAMRKQFVDNIREPLQSKYAHIAAADADLKIDYVPSDDRCVAHIDGFLEALKAHRQTELVRQQTLVGPHRDDVVFYLNGMDARRHASRGEQKSILLALKFIEYEYLKRSSETRPLLLLDDIYSELDEQRQLGVVEQLTEIGQSFITATHLTGMPGDGSAVFKVVQGTLQRL